MSMQQGLKGGLVVFKRLIEAHIWLIINLVRAIVETIVKYSHTYNSVVNQLVYI